MDAHLNCMALSLAHPQVIRTRRFQLFCQDMPFDPLGSEQDAGPRSTLPAGLRRIKLDKDEMSQRVHCSPGKPAPDSHRQVKLQGNVDGTILELLKTVQIHK